MKHTLLFFLCLIGATLVGCGSGEKKTYTNVKGTVIFNGKPLDKGEATFAVAGKPPTFMDVSDGKFSGQAMVGTNIVSFSAKRQSGTALKLSPAVLAQVKAYKEKGPGNGGGDPNKPMVNTVDLIPPEWGPESKQTRVVEAGAANDFEFSIKTK
jgi:hypothetical protein